MGRRGLVLVLAAVLSFAGCDRLDRLRARVSSRLARMALARKKARAKAARSAPDPRVAERLFAVATAPIRAEHPRLLLDPESLHRLAERAQSGPAWRRLRERCERRLTGKIEWPDGNDWADFPNVGEGYQGEGYFDPLLELGLCHQMARELGLRSAEAFGRKGAEVLERMAATDGPHAVNPARDDVFGIRFYGVGMALGYDWLHDALPPALKEQVWRAINKWIAVYEEKGFGRDHPLGNYFAGYYAAKVLGALATAEDNPDAPWHWSDWLYRVHGQMVQPYYEKNLTGGGWPEGWNYGVRATFNMILPALAVRTARGVDLVHAPMPFPFPIDQGPHLVHFSWPSRLTLDDRADQKPGLSPSSAQPWLFTYMAGALGQLGAPSAPELHRYARELRELRRPRSEPSGSWDELLFWDPDAPERDYRSLPLAFSTAGMQTAVTRSSWNPDAVWVSFTAGTFVNTPDNAEMGFDQGGVVVVRGATPLLGNAKAMLARSRPGTDDGDLTEQRVYDDLYGNHDANPAFGNRTLYNIFYARARNFGQTSVGPDDAETHLGLFEDRPAYTLLRGEQLEQMYRTDPDTLRPTIAEWSRTVAYLRPSLVVIEDRTRIARPTDQWMAFHLCGAPTDGVIACGGHPVGRFAALWPERADLRTVDVFGAHKVQRVEVRPADAALAQRWLTVLDADPTAPPPTRLRTTGGDGIGVLVERPQSANVVVSLTRPREAAHYQVPAKDGVHLVYGLDPAARYAVEVTRAAEGLAVVVRTGGALAPSAGGALALQLSAERLTATPVAP